MTRAIRKQQAHTKQHGPPPASFTCPLSGEIMEQPVMDLCAHTFERKAITEWLGAGHSCCPISRKPLTPDDLMPNHIMAERIDCWQFHHYQQQQQAHDGIIKVKPGSTSSETDDEEALFSNIRPKRGATRNSTKIDYQSVLPAEFMLLPQEREVLAMVRLRKEEQDALLRKQRCYSTMLSLTVIGAVAIVVVTAGWMFVQMDRDDSDEV